MTDSFGPTLPTVSDPAPSAGARWTTRSGALATSAASPVTWSLRNWTG